MSELNDVFGENSYREKALAMNAEEFQKLVHSRRSVRKFTKEKITENIMRECLNLALLAPNSSNLQPWEFYWVRDPNKRESLHQAFLSQPAATTAAEIVVAVARTKTWQKHAKQILKVLEENNAKSVLPYYKKIVPFVYGLGFLGLFGYFKKILLFFVGLKKPVPREQTDESQMRIWAVKSCTLACQNLMLAFRAYGFDSCPMEGMDSKRLKSLLGLASDAVVVMGISAGKRAEDGVYGPRFRLPREQFIKEV